MLDAFSTTPVYAECFLGSAGRGRLGGGPGQGGYFDPAGIVIEICVNLKVYSKLWLMGEVDLDRDCWRLKRA